MYLNGRIKEKGEGRPEKGDRRKIEELAGAFMNCELLVFYSFFLQKRVGYGERRGEGERMSVGMRASGMRKGHDAGLLLVWLKSEGAKGRNNDWMNYLGI